VLETARAPLACELFLSCVYAKEEAKVVDVIRSRLHTAREANWVHSDSAVESAAAVGAGALCLPAIYPVCA
jgi:hypothetical protein